MLTPNHWISHRYGLSLARGTSEMPSSAPVGQVMFLQVLWFSPTSDEQSAQYKLNILERAIKGNKT